MTANQAVQSIAGSRRTILLGGMAVILHGLPRVTRDVDIWVDPGPSEREWSDWLLDWLRMAPGFRATRLPVGDPVDDGSLPEVIAQDHLIRLAGADQPLDVFRVPNEFGAEEFGEVWNRATSLAGQAARLIDPIDLIITKKLTGRERDMADILFLEEKVENDARARVSGWSVEDAARFFTRFETPALAHAVATLGRDEAVREFGKNSLRAFAAEGDPFAADFLGELGG